MAKGLTHQWAQWVTCALLVATAMLYVAAARGYFFVHFSASNASGYLAEHNVIWGVGLVVAAALSLTAHAESS